jgi:hypothetical protein
MSYDYLFMAARLLLDGGSHALLTLDRRIEIYEISIRVTEVNGPSSPRLGGGWLYPGFHKALQSPVFLIYIVHAELKHNAFVLRRFG